MKRDYKPVYGKGSSPEVQKMQDCWNYSELEELLQRNTPLNDRQVMIYKYLVNKLDVKDPVIDFNTNEE
jgi:hypothetical protein